MFTLIMLLFFEGMLCKQRQNNLFMLRNMRRPPQGIMTLRCSQWFVVSSEELVPGDIISLSTATAGGGGAIKRDGNSDEPLIIPCDGILLSGSCVVNEAMLTGESVPQVKESLTSADNLLPNSVLDIGVEINSETAANWKKHVVLSGTSLLQHSSDVVSSDRGMLPSSAVSTPTTTSRGNDDDDSSGGGGGGIMDHAGGCKVLVLRTGFGTTQVGY